MTRRASRPRRCRPASKLRREVLFTNCSGVMYSSLQVGRGLLSSLNTADTSDLVCWELMNEAGRSVFTRLVTYSCRGCNYKLLLHWHNSSYATHMGLAKRGTRQVLISGVVLFPRAMESTIKEPGLTEQAINPSSLDKNNTNIRSASS